MHGSDGPKWTALAVTVLGLVFYVAVVVGFLVLLDID
jgi:hypothetical protein